MNFDKVRNAIRAAEEEGLINATNTNALTGYSGRKLVGTLQRLVNLYSEQSKTCYLEIGVYQGLTLLSVASANQELKCFGIDNFAYFDPDNKNKSIVLNRMNNLKIKNANLIDRDYEDALESLEESIGNSKIGVYFIDGPHDYRSQLMCLELALPYLHESAIIVIDDSNYAHVRQANRDFLMTHPEYKLIFEAYTECHPHNMPENTLEEAKFGWWNGVNIMMRDPENYLLKIYPPTERSRILYENEHIIHSANIAKETLGAIAFAQAVYSKNPIRIVKKFFHLLRTLYSTTHNEPPFESMNTYSKNLPRSSYNPGGRMANQ